ncbi:MAG: hypothetical protein HOW73_43615 [Polyangiaceae bacterium]|nr:hypothetical protein [Polyangiaceae bacterium]
MIYTVGYQRMRSNQALLHLARSLDATVIDVRSRPSGRVKRGFSRADLEAALGPSYRWAGDDLGGLGAGVTDAGIEWLLRFSCDHDVVLLCKEHAPGECHRHHDIALRVSQPVLHIFDDELVTAVELHRAIAEDDDYDIAANVGEVIASETARNQLEASLL